MGAVTGAAYGVAWVVVMSLTGWGTNLFWVGITPGLSVPAALIGAALGTLGGLCAGIVASQFAKHATGGLLVITWSFGGAIGGLAASGAIGPGMSLGWCGPPVLVGALSAGLFGFWVERRDAYWYS